MLVKMTIEVNVINVLQAAFALILVAFSIEPTAVVPNRGAATHMGTTSYYISMDIRPILTPRVATKLLNNSVRVVVRHKRLKNTGLQCKSWAYL